MEEVVLKAVHRTEEVKKVRKAGFTPGVLHEHDATSTSVQFDSGALSKIIARHGHNAKIWVTLDKEKKFGFIKEIQYHPVEGKIIHVAMQIVSKDQEVKMMLPIVFHGRDALEQRRLHLQVVKAEIEVIGKTLLMPDNVAVDVDKKELGDTITAADFKLPKKIKSLDAETEIYAIVKAAKEIAAVVEPEPAPPAEQPVSSKE